MNILDIPIREKNWVPYVPFPPSVLTTPLQLITDFSSYPLDQSESGLSLMNIFGNATEMQWICILLPFLRSCFSKQQPYKSQHTLPTDKTSSFIKILPSSQVQNYSENASKPMILGLQPTFSCCQSHHHHKHTHQEGLGLGDFFYR